MGGDLFFDVLAGEWSLCAGRLDGAFERCREGGELGCLEEVRTFSPGICGIPCYSWVEEARLLLWGFEAVGERCGGGGSGGCWRLACGIAEAAEKTDVSEKKNGEALDGECRAIEA